MSKDNKDDKAAKNIARKQQLDEQLDRELEDTFPASDALKITRKSELPSILAIPRKS